MCLQTTSSSIRSIKGTGQLQLGAHCTFRLFYLCSKMHDSIDLLLVKNMPHQIRRLNIALDELHKDARSSPFGP